MRIGAENRARIFRDRGDAGRQLGEHLAGLGLEGDLLVFGLPRGGMPLAREVATALDAPMDALVVRKIGVPFNPELAVGAIGAGGVVVYNEDVLYQLMLDESALDGVRQREQAELERRENKYRQGRPFPAIEGKTVIVVDDGIATGATMLAAVEVLRTLEPAEIIVAVPTASQSAVSRLERVADRVIALSTPEPYIAVGAWYGSFGQLTDDDVVRLLEAEYLARSDTG
jgi:putative phosphoribosyl transferase